MKILYFQFSNLEDAAITLQGRFYVVTSNRNTSIFSISFVCKNDHLSEMLRDMSINVRIKSRFQILKYVRLMFMVQRTHAKTELNNKMNILKHRYNFQRFIEASKDSKSDMYFFKCLKLGQGKEMIAINFLFVCLWIDCFHCDAYVPYAQERTKFG